MSDNGDGDSPVIDSSKVNPNLLVPPVAIVLLGFIGYFLVFFFIFLIRYILRSKGTCQDDICACCRDGTGFCQCIAACADVCKCGTPTVDKCLDFCCPKKNVDCVGLILCQCCGTPDNPCCACPNNPCCSYGDLDCNCACIQPDLDSVNCCCCQIGTPNYGRADLD